MPIQDKYKLMKWYNKEGKIIEFPVFYTLTTKFVSKYDWITEELLEYVHNAKSEEDAVANIKLIIAEYKNRMSLKETFKLFVKKLMK